MEMGAARWVPPPPPPEMPWEAPKAVLSSAGHAGQRGPGSVPSPAHPKSGLAVPMDSVFATDWSILGSPDGNAIAVA